MQPNYQKIYQDILDKKFPLLKEKLQHILIKKQFTVIDVLFIHEQIFGKKNENTIYNQKLRSYDKNAILWILDYQKKHKMNNSQLANHFRLSRNTITKWKKQFLND